MRTKRAGQSAKTDLYKHRDGSTIELYRGTDQWYWVSAGLSRGFYPQYGTSHKDMIRDMGHKKRWEYCIPGEFLT